MSCCKLGKYIIDRHGLPTCGVSIPIDIKIFVGIGRMSEDFHSCERYLRGGSFCEYFLRHASQEKFFFEQGAFDDSVAFGSCSSDGFVGCVSKGVRGSLVDWSDRCSKLFLVFPKLFASGVDWSNNHKLLLKNGSHICTRSPFHYLYKSIF